MTIRVLIIDDRARAGAARVVEYASRPENLYVPGPGAKIPGDDPGHVLRLGDYRMVFSLTKVTTGEVYRHFSMSVPAKSKFPHPVVVDEVLELFGFVGGLKKSQSNVNEKDGCVIAAQLLRSHPHVRT
jgi:hypothetical protein